jgi:hypothetical protein
VHLEFLPANSSELQPAVRLWALANEAVASRFLQSLAELEEVGGALRGVARRLRDDPFVHQLPLVARCHVAMLGCSTGNGMSSRRGVEVPC